MTARDYVHYPEAIRPNWRQATLIVVVAVATCSTIAALVGVGLLVAVSALL